MKKDRAKAKAKKAAKAVLYIAGMLMASGLTYIIVDKKVVAPLKADNFFKDLTIKDLQCRCNEKDYHFKKLMSDKLRGGSSLAGEYMADRKLYLKEIGA